MDMNVPYKLYPQADSISDNNSVTQKMPVYQKYEKLETFTSGDYELELRDNEIKIDKLLKDLQKYKKKITRFKNPSKAIPNDEGSKSWNYTQKRYSSKPSKVH